MSSFLRTRDALPHRESNQGFTIFRLRYQPGALPTELRRRCPLLLQYLSNHSKV